MCHLKDSIHINVPAYEVWEFGEDPHNWAKFMTGVSEPNKVIGDGGVGTQYQLTIRMAGLPMHVTSRLTEDHRFAGGSSHCRFEMTGASSGWMTWDLQPDDGGTLVTLEEEHTIPGNALRQAADRLIIERIEARDMHRSLENLKRLVEGAGESPRMQWDEHD